MGAQRLADGDQAQAEKPGLLGPREYWRTCLPKGAAKC
jgi:hypothetical protein